jgi:hypothetical protein
MSTVHPWFDDPVQLVTDFALIPNQYMTPAQRLNAIGRSTILGTLALYAFTNRPEVIVGGAGVLGYTTLDYVNKHANGNPQFLNESAARPMFPEQQQDRGVNYSGMPGQVYAQMVQSQNDFSKDLLVEPGTNQRLPLPPTHFDRINGERLLIQKLSDYDDEMETLFNSGSEHLHLAKFVTTA